MPAKILKRKKYNHDIYQKISHAERVKMIYDNKVHDKSIKQLVSETGIKYNTIRNIVICYEQTGRTNKKSFILSSKNKLNHKVPASKPKQIQNKELLSSSTSTGDNSSTFGSRVQVTFVPPKSAQMEAGLKALSNPNACPFTQGVKYVTPLTTSDKAVQSRCTLRLLTSHDVDSSDLKAGLTESKERYEVSKCQDSDFYNCVDAEIIPFDITSYEKEKETPYNLFCGPLADMNTVLRNEGVPLSQQQAYLKSQILSSLSPLKK
jgi:hypothetical protein